MAKDRRRGVIESFATSKSSGTIRLDDGRRVELPRSAVRASGIWNFKTDDPVTLYVNTRFGRLVAFNVRRATTAQSKAAATGLAALAVRHPNETRILLVGRTGVGKSSAINTLLGAPVAKVGDFEPETASIEIYRGSIGRLEVMVVDTPGLCDARESKGNDRRYLAQLARTVGEIDLVLFVTELDDSRVRSDELRCIDLLTETFGPSLWENTVGVLTRADKVARKDFARVVQGRSAAIGACLEEVAPGRGAHVPLVPISNVKARTPDRERWLPKLWISVLERMHHDGFVPLFLNMATRIDADRSDPISAAPPKSTPPLRKPKSPGTRVATAVAQPSRMARPSSATPNRQPPAEVRETTTSSDGLSSARAASRASTASTSVVAPKPVTPERGEVVTPTLDDILPPVVTEEGARHAEQVRVTRVERTVMDSVPITQINFTAVSGGSPVIVNSADADKLHAVVERRAPGLLKKLAGKAAKWLAAKAGILLGQ